MASTRPRTGSVTAFDEHRGLGEVTEADTGEVVPFHCTAIADDTRTIAEGTEVTFTLRPGPMGRWEAAGIRTR